MDELKLNLSTRFMRNIVTKMLAKAIKKKFGYEMDILLHELKVEAVDGRVFIHVNADAEMDKTDFAKLVTQNED